MNEKTILSIEVLVGGDYALLITDKDIDSGLSLLHYFYNEGNNSINKFKTLNEVGVMLVKLVDTDGYILSNNPKLINLYKLYKI